MATKIKKVTISYTVKQLAKRYDKINFELAIQRNEVWDNARKSLLIHSLLYGYPIPAVSARKLDNSDVDYILDGKQRLTTIFRYIKQGDPVKDAQGNKIPLRDEKGNIINDLYETWPGFPLVDVPEITYIDEENSDAEVTIDVNGMRFLDLPEFLRDDLLGQSISVTRFENMTDEEQDEMFLRTNNGMALRNMELTRAHAGGIVMKFIEEIANKPFFAHSVAITDKARDRFTDDESVLQALSLVYYAGTENVPGFSGAEMKEFVGLLRDQGGFPDDKAALVSEVTDYLGAAFPHKESSLKKVHIPSLFVVAVEAKKLGITPEKFGGYWQEFMSKRYKVGSTYGVAASRGSAKKENVARRVDEMMKDFAANIEKAPNYTEPKKVQNERAKAAEIARAAEEARKQAEQLALKAAEEAAAQNERNSRVLETGEGGDEAEKKDEELVKA